MKELNQAEQRSFVAKKSAYLTSLVIIGLVAINLSCSENSNGEDNPSGTLNPELTGTLYFEYQDVPFLMDLKTGNFTFIEGSNWEEDLDFPLGIANYDSKPFPESKKLLLTIENCLNIPGSINSNYSCILVQDFEGNFHEELKIKYDVSPGAKVAPDEDHIALVRELDEDWLEIYRLNGEFISGVQVSPTSFQWMPGGGLVYSYERNIVFTKIYSAEDSLDLTLPDNFAEGYIDYLSVSPDGNYVAFALIYDGTITVSTYSTFWLLNLETHGLHQVATIHESELQTGFTNSSWSPDGNLLAIYQGGFTGSGSQNPGSFGQIYVLPVNEDKTYIASADEEERSPEVILMRRYEIEPDYYDNRQGSEIKNDFPEVEFHWLRE